MFALILATVSLFPVATSVPPAVIQQKPDTLLQALFPEPTGQNGLEDYLRAIDLMNDGVSEVYSGGSGYVNRYEADELKAAKAKLADQLKPLDYLANRKALGDRYGEAYDLIVQGNQKPCITPPPSDIAPKGFPSTVRVAELVQARAYGLSAEGKESESLETLLNGLTFTLRSGSTNYVAYLSDVLAERKLFDELLDQLPRLSLMDAQRLEAYANEAVNQPPLAADLIRRGEKVHEIMFSKGTAGQALTGGNPGDFPEYRKLLANATQAQLDAFSQGVKDAETDSYRVQEGALLQPESQWYDASGSWKTAFALKDPLPSDSIADLAKSFSRVITTSYRNLVLTELRRRAQMRLLGLHARVLEYRWHNHRLPAGMKDIADDRTAFDPLSGESFVYEPHPDGTYRLFSKGRKETGVVELHYVGKPSDSLESAP